MTSEDRGLITVTGANGTIGYNSVLHAVRTGYRVRCIVRREEAISTIQAGPSLKPFADKIGYVVVPDNTVPEAYDAALENAKYVVHVAGVWPMPHYHPDNDIWYPFVKSMENILSAAKTSGTVRRVVFTQAGAGLVSPDDGDTLGNQMDRVLNEYVKVDRRSASYQPPLNSPHHAYCGAKAFCMQHLLDLKKPGNLPFSIVQVIPGTVIGTSELVHSAAEAEAHMDRMSRALLFNQMAPRYAFGFVDAEDCARVHIEALDEDKVRDHEIPDWFVAAATTNDGKTGPQVWNEVGDMIETEFAKEVKSGLFNVGRANVPINMPFRVDSRQTERALLNGDKFKDLASCIRDVAGWYSGFVDLRKGASA